MASDYQNDSDSEVYVYTPGLRRPVSRISGLENKEPRPCPSPAGTFGLLADQVVLDKLPQSTRTTIGG